MLNSKPIELNDEDLRYLQLLAKQYPTIESASSEIINLQAILNLPKGTEHFVSDIHGEYASFRHVLKNASGVIKDLIDRVFGNTMRECEKKALATLIYYPEKKLAIVEKTETDINDWYRIILHRMIIMCKAASSKYTRSKVRKALPKNYSYIIEELLHEEDSSTGSADKQQYYDEIIETIIRLYRANDFIIEMAHLIQRLAIDRLHVIGDIYDRGRDAVKIMDMISNYHSVDIQWGNHDISWMGAAAGCRALICNVIRIQARYANLDTIEEAYGINLIPLATFAMEKYKKDPCEHFMPSVAENVFLSEKEINLIAKMHKAITIMQFKCEAQIIKRNPNFNMDDRILLEKINFEDGTIEIEGVKYELNDTEFPTVDPKNPTAFTEEELDVLEKITVSFVKNEKLQSHVRFLFTHGSLYTIFNSNLLFHGCLPMNEDGTLKEVSFRGERLKGREYFDSIDRTIREGYFNVRNTEEKNRCLDETWYMWCGSDSPVFGKVKMTTFERYFIDDPASHKEKRNPYYLMRDNEAVCDEIMTDFGLDPSCSHIINGHVPVQVTKGERPVKANGKLFVIDGGFAKAYQKVTGIAGYTLIYNSHGLVLVSHEPFESVEIAVREEKDILSSTVEYHYSKNRILVADTDTGRNIKRSICELEKLLYTYNKGLIKEKIV
ncbi:MAG: fructose-1,6-bisphosphatase [Clostridia bacterium]|nr:fructose-1,6-bisphosphatase [Clostridia bacterium]